MDFCAGTPREILKWGGGGRQTNRIGASDKLVYGMGGRAGVDLRH